MKPQNVLILGAGGVAHVTAHKCAQYNDILGDICIASRTQAKCDKIIAGIHRKGHLKEPARQLTSRQIDATDTEAVVRLIEDTNSGIVLNLAQPFVNMMVLEACLQTGAAYLDTAVHEENDLVCEDPPWYANHEWKRAERCQERGVTAILGAGFDPGVVNAYCAFAAKHHFDRIETIDILDVNAGHHGMYFATNFDPEINFREFTIVWSWINREWVCSPVHDEKWVFDFPEVGPQPVYLTGHDEIHSLARFMDVDTIRFWMGFSDHYIKVFNVLNNVGMLSEKPVRTAEGLEVVPLKVLKAVLPDPMSLAPHYKGKTCIGCLVKGEQDGESKELFIYNISDHAACYREVGSQAISYTAGVPPAAAAVLMAQEIWLPKTMVNVEQLDPDPFLDLLEEMGLPTLIEDRTPSLRAN